MSKLRLFTAWARLLAILGGCGGVMAGASGCAGRPASAHLQSAKLTSPATLQSKDKITALAYTDHSPIGWSLEMKVTKLPPGGQPEVEVSIIDMHDDGRGGDKAKDDAEWYGEYKENWEPGAVYHVTIELDDVYTGLQTITLPDDIALASRMPAAQSDADARGGKS
jgi:hypothetical protein